jgi:hypothetical protein
MLRIDDPNQRTVLRIYLHQGIIYLWSPRQSSDEFEGTNQRTKPRSCFCRDDVLNRGMLIASDFAPSFETPEASSFAKALEERSQRGRRYSWMLSRLRFLVLVIKASWNKVEFKTGCNRLLFC